MRLLLLADLHNRCDWYAWVAQQASQFDVIGIGGDLLDGFDPGGLFPQMEFLRGWTNEIAASGAILALASGNHDGNDSVLGWRRRYLQRHYNTIERRRFAIFASEDHWMDILKKPGKVVVDGASSLIASRSGESIVVTCIPYLAENRIAQEVWETGSLLRKQNNLPWLVLHHEPPAGTRVGGPTGNISLFYKILEYRPDFVLSGHIHDRPYRNDGGFADNIEGSWCLNPGCQGCTSAPNRIILDTVAGNIEWHGFDMRNGRWLKQMVRLAG